MLSTLYLGPALCLYFAALRCTTNPPSVPLPRKNAKHSGGEPVPQMDLSLDNCPPAFTSFLEIWSQAVPDIQALLPEHQHDLARIICGLPPITVPPSSPTYSSSSPASSISQNLNRISADLRAVAIEISQRRSFQERYGGDLQAAIDTDGGGSVKAKASFVPPPMYTPSPTSSFSGSLPPSPAPAMHTFPLQDPPHSPTYGSHLGPPSPSFPVPSIPQGPSYAGPSSSSSHQYPQHEGSHHRDRTPSILGANSPAIELIRETLYAALGDVLEATPSLRSLLKTDPPRAYYASVALSILRMSTTNVTEEGTLIGVLGQEMKIEAAPAEIRPFVREFADIGRTAHMVEEEDTTEVVRLLEAGKTELPEPRIDRVREILERGVGHHNSRPPRDGAGGGGGSGRRSTEGRAVAFANRINALALGMTKLRAFRERQNDVFKVLAGVGAS